MYSASDALRQNSRCWLCALVAGNAGRTCRRIPHTVAVSAAEKIAGPYVWGIYDLLLLPPSFPYGGMVRRHTLNPLCSCLVAVT